ncbi:Hypothetical protein RG1141_CH31480 [Neorhizobium galegae bv. officinalis bv. officinalis str. HAMBI 1141]|uniref:Uncharacterized protein n=1 Tax=Neorhizobium galegae bv. officinalis bv. officinalis str. HAMBI 1141 TaxID=1028801 RepID=A0A068TAM0_NEOGA|nr:Hypothetical protein RG1141_CH31480 [Neorhizobium galegae bv. officinalis bv. officinalis str. HAMBI 1141]
MHLPGITIINIGSLVTYIVCAVFWDGSSCTGVISELSMSKRSIEIIFSNHPYAMSEVPSQMDGSINIQTFTNGAIV